MGYFSWITQDTNKSIVNCHQKVKEVFEVTLTDNLGNKWVEEAYEGFGEFGGKDFYVLLAEMNGKTTGKEGIALYFGNEEYISPNLTEDPNHIWVNKKVDDCNNQGYFNDEEE